MKCLNTTVGRQIAHCWKEAKQRMYRLNQHPNWIDYCHQHRSVMIRVVHIVLIHDHICGNTIYDGTCSEKSVCWWWYFDHNVGEHFFTKNRTRQIETVNKKQIMELDLLVSTAGNSCAWLKKFVIKNMMDTFMLKETLLHWECSSH